VTRPPRPPASLLGLVLVLVTLIGACGGGGQPSAPAHGDALHVVATTTMFADMVTQVGGEHVTVTSLVPKGGEVHTFDPTPADVRRLTDADLVVRNGLGLDDWLAALVADAGSAAPVVALAEDLEGVEYLAGAEADEPVNPHLWLDPVLAARYAERIAEALSAADPDNAPRYEAGREAFAEELAELDREIAAAFEAIPEADRNVIAFHDAFPYFAARYGLAIDGTIVSAPGQDPSAGDLADLIRVVEAQGVKAILAEAQFNDDLAQTIAQETGATVVSGLLTESTGDATNDSYAEAMRWNARQVAAALGAG
jgi:manganese/iron transport system substrate-binding protein